MTTHLKQPTSTPVMIAAARRALNADRAYLQADNVVRCDRFADFDGEERFQAVQFARGGAVTTGWWSPNRDWDYSGDIMSGESGTFYPAAW